MEPEAGILSDKNMQKMNQGVKAGTPCHRNVWNGDKSYTGARELFLIIHYVIGGRRELTFRSVLACELIYTRDLLDGTS